MRPLIMRRVCVSLREDVEFEARHFTLLLFCCEAHLRTDMYSKLPRDSAGNCLIFFLEPWRFLLDMLHALQARAKEFVRGIGGWRGESLRTSRMSGTDPHPCQKRFVCVWKMSEHHNVVAVPDQVLQQLVCRFGGLGERGCAVCGIVLAIQPCQHHHHQRLHVLTL